jgi:hypothetical protein
MKITIEAETPEELAALAEPWVRANVRRIGLAAWQEATAGADGKVTREECGFIHGPFGAVKADLLRLLLDVDNVLARQAAFDGTIEAHNALAKAQRDATLMQKIAPNGRGLRMQRP